ncbi:hypothetical protein [Streptomyces sp. NPDC012510]|uniref:hypothetical protein n=1 Tax=Streptomyces sp. NPDC012510 TaxID=3364838 RepID=UPI0036E54B2F
MHAVDTSGLEPVKKRGLRPQTVVPPLRGLVASSSGRHRENAGRRARRPVLCISQVVDTSSPADSPARPECPVHEVIDPGDHITHHLLLAVHMLAQVV